MQLTVVEKIVIGINIFLLFVLFLILTAHYLVVQSGIDLRSRLSLSSNMAAPSPVPDIDNSREAPNFNTDLSVVVPQPTNNEEVSADQPRRPWVGWAIVITSSLLLIAGIALKFIRS